jgi:hypothetical protein
MKNPFAFALAFIAFSALASAQPDDHAWLETSRLKVRVNADGRLFCDDEKGAFLVPHNDTLITLMGGAGLWLGGIDMGTPRVSMQTENPAQNDFAAGFRGIPNSGRVWKVTRDEIIAHVNDYLEDFDIDHPIPSIFGWPAFGNPHFFQYNGFDLPGGLQTFGYGALDESLYDGTYDPAFGDFPKLTNVPWGSIGYFPAEIVAFAFYSNVEQGNEKYPVQVLGQAFVYDCPESDLLTRSVFVDYKWVMGQTNRLIDTCVVTSYINPDIGDPADDFHGIIPEKTIYFAFNADSTDAVWGDRPPVLLVKTIKQPGVRYSPLELRFRRQSLMPCGCPSGECPYPMVYPNNVAEAYNYQTGSWQDGTPLVAFGNGYYPDSNLHRILSAFVGYPDQPHFWTEINANNTPGDRKGLINNFINREYPTLSNQLTLMYSYSTETNKGATNAIKDWEEEYHDDFEPIVCCNDLYLGECIIDYLKGEYQHPDPLTVFPNPADQYLRVWHPYYYLNKMLLYNQLGYFISAGQYKGQYSEISVADLPAGMYILVVETENGDKKTARVMVAHGVR